MLNKSKGKPGEDLIEAAVQGCSLKQIFFKRKQNLENDMHVYSFFKTVAGRKPAASPKSTPSEFLEFALYVLRFLNILRIFICLYSAITIILCVNYEETKMIDAL